MINVIVSYTIQPDFLQENKNNIQQFLKDFEQLDISRFNYDILYNAETFTFTHISKYSDDQIQKELLNMPSFLEFQRKRDASGLNNSHKVQILEWVGGLGKL